jgi:hypothetical protein
MRVCADIPFGARAVRLDLFRGLANWAIFLDHIPHEVLNWTTIRNYGFSDAADLDVLPLYILLLGAFAPALWLIVRKPNWVLAGSIGVYLAGRHFGWNLATSPSGSWYFNPFAWQLLFVLGAWTALGGARAVQPVLATRTAFWLAIGFLLFRFFVTTAIRFPDLGGLVPHWVLAPFDPNDKTNLAPYRVVHFIALAVVVTRLLPLDSPMLRWRALAPLIQCGRRSLQVFCLGVVLSFCAHAAIELSLNSLWIQIFAGMTGILVMTAVAYCVHWSKQRDGVLASSTRIGGFA